MAVIHGNSILVIDAGLMFPGPAQPGVELIIPDFAFLRERAQNIVGVVLTHGHEDHIGALPYLLKDCPKVPVLATRLTLAMARERLAEQRIAHGSLQEIKPRDRRSLGPFDLEFLSVSHSILDAVGLAIGTPAGVIVHTGDFKMDLSAPPADQLDLFKFAEIGEKGVLALLSDSTNSDALGHSVSEKAVGASLSEIFQKATGRVILACFASSLARIREIAQAAEKADRRLVFDGRSMIGNVRLAQELGYLELGPGAEISFDDASFLDDRELVIVVTGSQGEPLSALARMAAGEHRKVVVQSGDTIIFSARAIPGNETAVNTLINLFQQLGAEIFEPRSNLVHASGHAHAEELRLMLSLVKPHYLVPVHGELRQLNNHALLAVDHGLPRDRVIVSRNGQRISLFADKRVEFQEKAPTGRKLVEGNRLGTPDDPVLRVRRKMAEFGLVIASLALERETLKLIAPPKVTVMGVQYAAETDLAREAEEVAARVARDFAAEWAELGRVPDPEDHPPEVLTERLKSEIRGVFRNSINRKPMVSPQIILWDGAGS
jgi:ribonuclease J